MDKTKGIITKGVGGFYYVKTENGLIESRARGVFRENNLTPLVGDKVNLRINKEDNTGYIVKIQPRHTQLLRPPVANITQVINVMSVKNPEINTWLLDRFLVMGEYENLSIVICINKYDLDEERSVELEEIYHNAGYKVILTSAKTGLGIKELEDALNSNISILAGPSGVGKSTLLNKINPSFQLEIGSISSKTRRGKHTTRHIELLELNQDSFILDSPGFSSLKLEFIENEAQLRNYFREINKYGPECAFLSCLHDQEPNCAVKRYVDEGVIHKNRYKNYISMLKEVRSIKRY